MPRPKVTFTPYGPASLVGPFVVNGFAGVAGVVGALGGVVAVGKVVFGVSLLPKLIGFSPGTGVTLMLPGVGMMALALGDVAFAVNLLLSPGIGR